MILATLANTRRDLLRRYHDWLSPIFRGYELRAESKEFRAENKIAADDPIMPAIREIFGAHDGRCRGLGSPAECDDVWRKVSGQ